MGLRYDFYDPNKSFVIHPTEVVKVRLKAPPQTENVTKCYAYFPVQGLFHSLHDFFDGLILVFLEDGALFNDSAESFDGLEPGVLFEFYVLPHYSDSKEGCSKALSELKILVSHEHMFASMVSISY